MGMHSASQIIFLWLSLVVRCQGYSKFDTTCSTPSISVNFVSSPDSRGTLDILWSCLFTIVACTWTIQHLNVPKQRRGRDREHGHWCDFKWALKGFWTNLKWMLFTIIAPEVILGKALGDLLGARHYRERMQAFAEEDGVEWELTHGFYANMGGFFVLSEDDSHIGESQNKRRMANHVPLVASEIFWLRSHYRETEQTGPLEEGSSETKRKAKLEKLPDITAAEIQDKSKGDVFVKVVASFQIFWVAMQIVVRVSKGLAIAQLELAVAAFSACTIITYTILLRKPQSVRVPSGPLLCEPGSLREIIETDEDGISTLRELFIPGLGNAAIKRERKIPNDALTYGVHVDGTIMGSREDNILLGCCLGMALGGVVLGSIHVAGWNLAFPTPIEQKLWRVSSILLLTLLPAGLLPVILSHCSLRVLAALESHYVTAQTWGFVCLLLYVVARLFILVETFRTLLYLPPDAYIATWASNIPHVA